MKVLLVVIALTLAGVAPAVLAGNGCGTEAVCSSTLSDGCNVFAPLTVAPGIYTLPNGIDICADGVFLDGFGATLQGTGSGSGISTNGFNFPVVTDFSVDGYSTGIDVAMTSGGLFAGNHLQGNRKGIALSGSDHNSFVANTAVQNTQNGISLYQSHFNTLNSNTVTGTQGGTGFAGNGIVMRYSDNNTFYRNVLTGNAKSGLFGRLSAGNIIQENTAAGNNRGIELEFADFSSLKRNTILENQWEGIMVTNGDFLALNRNTVRGNYQGISLGLSSFSAVTNNYVRGNRFSGIGISQGTGNIIQENQIVGNSRGLSLGMGADQNTVRWNRIRSNTGTGLELYQADSNTFSGNVIGGNGIGADLQSSTGNLLFRNFFRRNMKQAQDDTGNVWDNGPVSGGNRWSDFDQPGEGCTDGNDDGFCDVPFFIPVSSQDKYPVAI